MSAFMLILALASYGGLAALTARAMAARGIRLGRASPDRPSSSALTIAALGNASIGALVLLEHVYLGGRDLAELGLRWVATDAATCIAIAATTFALAATFAPRTNQPRRPEALLILALTCGAWMEELLFRGFFFAWLHPVGVVAALLASSAVFTLIHVPTSATDRYKIVDWLGGGLSLGLVYLLSGSVWVATAAHLSHNLANVWLISPPGSATGVVRPRMRSLYYAVLGAATVLVTIVAQS